MTDLDGASPVINENLVAEINDLTKKYKVAKSEGGDCRNDTVFYRTALRIAKARQKWEQNPFFKDEPFFQEFRIGFIRKKVAIFQIINGRWCGSYIPWKKFYGDKVEDVLKQMENLKR